MRTSGAGTEPRDHEPSAWRRSTRGRVVVDGEVEPIAMRPVPGIRLMANHSEDGPVFGASTVRHFETSQRSARGRVGASRFADLLPISFDSFALTERIQSRPLRSAPSSGAGTVLQRWPSR